MPAATVLELWLVRHMHEQACTFVYISYHQLPLKLAIHQ